MWRGWWSWTVSAGPAGSASPRWRATSGRTSPRWRRHDRRADRGGGRPGVGMASAGPGRALPRRAHGGAGPGAGAGPPRARRSLAVAAPLVRTGTGCTLRYGASVGARVVVRIEDPRRRWLPRRLAVRPPDRARAEASEADPPGVYLGAADRTVEAWLYPGPAYPIPAGSTGARLRVLRQGAPVAWPRLEVFAPGGVPAGWAHGDEHGDVLVLASTTGTIPPPAPATFPVAVRVHHPDPARPAGQGPPDPFQVPDTPEASRPGDRLSSLVAERVTA